MKLDTFPMRRRLITDQILYPPANSEATICLGRFSAENVPTKDWKLLPVHAIARNVGILTNSFNKASIEAIRERARHLQLP